MDRHVGNPVVRAERGQLGEAVRTRGYDLDAGMPVVGEPAVTNRSRRPAPPTEGEPGTVAVNPAHPTSVAA